VDTSLSLWERRNKYRAGTLKEELKEEGKIVSK